MYEKVEPPHPQNGLSFIKLIVPLRTNKNKMKINQVVKEVRGLENYSFVAATDIYKKISHQTQIK